MRRHCWFIVAALAVASTQTAQADQRQSSKWVPPATTIPTAYVQAAQKLLGKGLGDPRGGTFSRVTIRVGDAAWADASDCVAFGWVLPGGKRVVVVDGLTYDVVKVLGPASVSDVYRPLHRVGDVWGSIQDRAVPIASPTSALPALLLVRGQVTLAEECLSPDMLGGTEGVLNLFGHLIHRYRMQVAQCLKDRRDREALPWAESLAEVSRFRDEAGVNYPVNTTGWRFDPEEAKQILRDVRRRARHPKPPIDLGAIAKLQQPVRIAALIEGLDEIATRQGGQPGGIYWQDDPHIEAIVKEGNAIVPALLDTIEKDDRLTRAVSFGRNFRPQRKIESVRNAASMALYRVWPSAGMVFSDPSPERIGKLRGVWVKSASLSEPERWLNVLRDDAAGEKSWLQAANGLTFTRYRGIPSSASGLRPEELAMAGESLRRPFGDEVSALLAKRAQHVTANRPMPSTADLHAFANGMELAHCFAKWDLAKSISTLQLASTNALQVAKKWEADPEYLGDILARPFGNLVIDRIRSNDPHAASDFAKMTEFLKLQGSTGADALKPLWVLAGDPAMDLVAHRVFARLSIQLGSGEADAVSGALHYITALLRTPMVRSAAFRTFLAKSVAENEYAGAAWLTESAGRLSVNYSLGTSASGASWFIGIDPALLERERVPITVGDFIAQSVGSLKGAPIYSLILRRDLRPAALGQVRRWLLDEKVDWDDVAKAIPYYDFD